MGGAKLSARRKDLPDPADQSDEMTDSGVVDINAVEAAAGFESDRTPHLGDLGMNLDDVIPDPHYRVSHSRVVNAPAGVVWDELHGVTMSVLPLSRVLEAVRLLPARLSGKKHRPLGERS